MAADFRSWPQSTLADFAEASRTRMLEQDARIKDLEEQVRVAIDGYRALVITPGEWGVSQASLPEVVLAQKVRTAQIREEMREMVKQEALK